MDDQTKLMQAMARLSRHPDFKIFLEGYIQKELDNQIDGCITSTEPHLYQGAAQTLKKLIKDFEGAEEKYLALNVGAVPISQATSF